MCACSGTMEYSSDDARSRYSSETGHNALRVSREIWAAYLFSAADDLEYLDGTEEMQQCRQIAVETELNQPSRIMRSIYRKCKAKLQHVAKGIQRISKQQCEKSDLRYCQE